jgi:hypothetical protein
VGNAIFISYRRDDSEGEAGRLFDDLTGAFGTSGVFMDVSGISPGADFRKAIEDNVGSCGVLLAIIGPRWSSITDAAGRRRLEDPDDFVALEVASALKRNVPVIPVLVHEAKMPAADQFPETLKDLAYRNSVELTHTRWNSDCQLLIEALKSYVKPVQSDAGDPVHATVAVQLPAPRPETTAAPAVAARPNIPLIIAAVCAALLVLGGVVYLIARPLHSRRARIADSLRGRWVAPRQLEDDALEMVQISGSADHLSMQAWGACRPEHCDWGTQALTLHGPEATANYVVASPPGYRIRPRIATVHVHRDLDELDVDVHNVFSDAASPHESEVHRAFVLAK